MSKIFISYRRTDSAYISSYMYDELSRAFGKGNVFLDVDSIAGGLDYRQAIEYALDQCQVLIVMIGPQWLTISDEQPGLRRLDQPADAVRLEIEGGLRRSNMLVLPLLVENARMPVAAELPPSIAALSYRNAQQLRPGSDLRTDMERVITTIARYVPRVAASPISLPSSPGASVYAPVPRPIYVQPIQSPAAVPPVSTKPSQPTRPNRIWIPIVAIVLLLVLLCSGSAYLVAKSIQGAANSLNTGNNATATTAIGNNPTNATVPSGGPDITAQLETALANFCQALHDNQLSTAFDELTTGYQQSVGSANNLPNAVGGTFGTIQETASDCSFFGNPPTIKSGGTDAIVFASVTVSDSTFGKHTIGRNFEFVLTNASWLVNDIYAQ